MFVNGALVGPPNTPIEVACGFGFVRLGIPPEKGPHPTWIAEGKSVVIACRAETIVPSR